jgi:hypothetical protein
MHAVISHPRSDVKHRHDVLSSPITIKVIIIVTELTLLEAEAVGQVLHLGHPLRHDDDDNDDDDDDDHDDDDDDDDRNNDNGLTLLEAEAVGQVLHLAHPLRQLTGPQAQQLCHTRAPHRYRQYPDDASDDIPVHYTAIAMGRGMHTE